MIKNKWRGKKPEDASNEGFITFLLTDNDYETRSVDIKTGSELIPQWYKDIPAKVKLRTSDTKEDFSIKRCIPVLDAITTGYYLVTSKDYTFTYDKDSQTSKISGLDVSQKNISMHPVTQLGGMPFSPEFIKYAYKWGNEYTIKTPPGYSILFTHPLNYPYLPFYTLSGVVDTDTYIMPVLFPFMMKNNFEGVIPAGTPIVQIIPFKRDDWNHDVINKPHDLYRGMKEVARVEYESGRYDKDGNPAGGMYKRDYRKKKKYL
jgi:hypothetical protein